MPKKNYSGWTKEELIAHIEKLEKRKKYGLVWDEERTREEFEMQAQNSLPVLEAVIENDVTTDPAQPTHILIEGDNFHALSVLNYTHEKKVDVIYIDPPYNTGKKKEFKFNDRFVDREDAFRHSKWLSFMAKRLILAKTLLKDEGLIIISIDDNELCQLRLLCEEIFGEGNYISILPTVINLKGNNDQFGFAGTHEYVLVYAKNKSVCKIGEFIIDDEGLEDWDEDEIGLFKQGANLKATGVNAPREKRQNLWYAIFVTKDDDIYVTENDELPEERAEKGDVILWPITDGQEMSWRWEKRKVGNEPHNLIIVRNGNTVTIYKKQRPKLGDIPTKKPKTIFYKPEYSSGNGTQLLKNMFGKKVFENPKPIELIVDLLFLTTDSNSLVLDFFGGSGTTAHAVMELNARDNGSRRSIICTDDQDNICHDVCFPRIQKAILGYENMKNVHINGLGGNLMFYRTSFVPAEPSDENKEKLTRESVEMLCLRESAFDFVTETDVWKIYENQSHFTAILFDQLAIPDLKEYLKTLDKPVSVYIFSLEDEDFAREFRDMQGKITTCPIPEAILRVYRRIYQ